MTAVQDFKNDPVGFMQNNIIVVRFGWSGELHQAQLDAHAGSSLIGRREILTLTKMQDNQARGYRRGTTMGWLWGYSKTTAVYKLEYGGAAAVADQIDVYWCPYNDGSTLGVALGSAADYMFTAPMDGCSLGLGAANPDGSRLVYHSNIRASTPENQEVEQALELSAVNADALILHPNAYRNAQKGKDCKVTAFGVRNGGWHVYYQILIYEPKIPAVWKLVGVKELE